MLWCTKIGAAKLKIENCGADGCESVANCGADGCDGSGSREKNDGFYFNIQCKNIGCIAKRSTCQAGRGRRSETRFRKIEGGVCPGFPLRAMSHADVISGALTEICTVLCAVMST